MFNAVRAEFGPDEVKLLAINDGEGIDAVLSYLQEVGLREPVLLDREGVDAGCYAGPDEGLYEHFAERVDGAEQAPPFPLQILVDGDGRLVRALREHRPDLMLTDLRELVP